MKLILKGKVCNLKGEPIKQNGEELLLNETVANALALSKENGIKFFDWATKLHNDGVIEIDDADRKLLEKFIETTQALSNFIKGPVLKALDSLKEEKIKGEK